MINIIDPKKVITERKLVGPITSSNYFLGSSFSFHPQGLHSEEIFGMVGSPDRRNSLSWIELNCKVFHPVYYDLISKTIARYIVKIISGESRFIIDENGYLLEDEKGDISGFTSLIKNIDKIKLRKDEKDVDAIRNKTIDLLYSKIKDKTIFIDKLIVISPEFRPVLIPDKSEDRPMIDDLNEIYVKVLNISNQLKSVSGDLFDILSYRMQLTLKDLFELIRVRISKKSGVIRDLMLGKRVDLSSRGVIAPNPDLHLGEVGVPFRMICSIFHPYLIYGLVNSPYAKDLPQEFHEAVKEYLGKELSPDMLM